MRNNGDRRRGGRGQLGRLPRRDPAPRPARASVTLAHGAPADAQRFEDDGATWIAWVAGRGLGGTGAAGLGRVEAIHFALAEAPDRPLLEVLIAHGRFEGLYPDELRRLRAEARAIEMGDTRPASDVDAG